MKTEVGMSAEDLTSGRAQIIDDDDDEHDEHDDSDKINDAEGMDPERLKAFNVSQCFSNVWISVIKPQICYTFVTNVRLEAFC